MPRLDGRANNTLRPLTCELSCLSHCDGSALWKSGGTHVLAAVHGPIAPRQQQYETDSAIVTILIKSGNANYTFEREWEDFLTRVVSASIDTQDQQHRRTVISVTLQIVSADGSVLAACLHATIAALMDAAIPLLYLPTAVTCYLSPNDDTSSNGNSADATGTTSSTLQLDPTLAEEQQQQGAVVVIVVGNNKHPTASSSNDTNTILASYSSHLKHSAVAYLECCAVAARAAPAVQAFWRLAMEQKVKRESQTLYFASN